MPAESTHTLQGLLVVDKPGRPLARGFGERGDLTERLLTSHDVVSRVRRWSGQRRIGHTGTLDPLASGVLVLCLGRATRLVEYYQGHDKTYLAEIALGTDTDTYDAEGTVTRVLPVPPLSAAEITAVFDRFRGKIWQVPPVYSALKQAGESLHRRARRGETVVPAARAITIHALDLVDWNERSGRLSVRLHCSAGTYVRSLAHDLGAALGTAAHLSALRREQAGPFTLQTAHTLAEVEQAGGEGRLAELLLPLGVGLALPMLVLEEEMIRRLGFGQEVKLEAAPIPAADRDRAAAYDRQGRFLGILRRLEGPFTRWHAEKWLLEPQAPASGQGSVSNPRQNPNDSQE